MSFFPSLPADAGVRHILALNPAAGRALIEFHSVALRSDTSSLTPAEKELIAAFVSGLNACQYCHGVHRYTAQAFGVASELLESLLKDFDAAPVDSRLKPVLAYARKLATDPSRMVAADAEAVFAAGWSELTCMTPSSRSACSIS